MIRHLNNISELVIYAALSTGAAFFVRLHPAFYFPILLLRLSVLCYAIYVVGNVQSNRPFAYCLIAALILGWLGGYWDYLELQIVFNHSEFIAACSLILGLVIAALAVVLLRGKNA